MFTPTKLIILGLILFAIWSIFRIIEKRNAVQDESAKKTGKTQSIELTECQQCGSWVDAPCEEANCPIRS